MKTGSVEILLVSEMCQAEILYVELITNTTWILIFADWVKYLICNLASDNNTVM